MANAQRTPEELRNPEYNYYIALKIDITETDKTKIEQKIKKELSSTSGSLVLRRLIELKEDILNIMVEDAVFENGAYKPGKGGRQKEAETAKKFKLLEARDFIQMLCRTRKTLLKSELAALYTSTNKTIKYFTEDEFYKSLDFLKDIGIKIIDNTDVKIPFDKFQKSDKLLEPVKKDNLFDYLGLPRTASISDIQSAAKKQYTDSQKSSDLKKKQSGSQLDGIIKEVFANESSKKSYEHYVDMRESVWDEFSKRKVNGFRELTMDEYELYIQKTLSAIKVPLDEAEKIIAIGCKYFQITIVGKSDDTSFEFCPFEDCGKLYIKGAKNCPHCGRSLEVMCWNCGKLMRLTKDDKGCASCGATRSAHDIFIKRCQELDSQLSRPVSEINQLRALILQIKNILPGYASNPSSVIAKKVAEYENLIDARIKQEETVGAKYTDEIVKVQQFIVTKCYQAALNLAKSLLVKYSTYNVDNSKRLIADITKVIQSAQVYVDTAKRNIAQGNQTQAIINAAKAIDLCDDFNDARQLMQKYPPRQVTNLRLSVEKNNIRLEWDDVKQEFVTYTVIKKIGMPPIDAEDGAVVDSGLSVCFVDDLGIVSATSYYYAVFCERYGIKSPVVTTKTPATIYSDIANLQQEIVDGGIKVVWDSPQNVKSVDVWKNSGPIAPSKAGEGKKIDCSLSGFYDVDAKGQNAYLIICNYEFKGKHVKSKGIKAVYKPYEKTIPLEEISIKNEEGNRYVFECKDGYNGKIKLYFSNTKLSVPTNKTLKYLDFNNICKCMTLLNTELNASGQVTFMLPVGKIYYIYSIVSTEQLFVISPPEVINVINAITECKHIFLNGVVTISGVLHPKAKSVVVRISETKFPSSVDEGNEKFIFKGDDFRRDGKIEIKLKSNTVNYISLFAQFEENGTVSYAPIIKLDAPIDYRESVTVYYCIQSAVSATKPFKVTILFEADGEVELPKMLLMQGSPKPLNKSVGKLTERIDGVKLKKGLFSKRYKGQVVLTVSPTATNTKFALFFNEDSTYIQMREVQKL